MGHIAPDAEVTKWSAKGKSFLNRGLRFVYPPRCIACGEETETERALCGACWSDSYFLTDPVCDCCGLPLPGGPTENNLLCDGCLRAPQSWRLGRAVVAYEGAGRRMTMALKHGDRLDIAWPMGRWMAEAGRDLLARSDVIVPVPLHWTRLLRRRYNQSAVLADVIGRLSGRSVVPDLLLRKRRTLMQKGMSREARFENQRQAIIAHPKRVADLRGQRILLIDDVLTTGATLSACAEACLSAGADEVNALVFARVAPNL